LIGEFLFFFLESYEGVSTLRSAVLDKVFGSSYPFGYFSTNNVICSITL
jgi:hypothetical protein